MEVIKIKLLSSKNRFFLVWTILFATFVYYCPSVFAEDYSISITTSGAVDIVGSAGEADIESSDIHVATTCRSGYNLVLTTSTSDNNMYLDGVKTDNTESAYIQMVPPHLLMLPIRGDICCLPLFRLQIASSCQYRPIH